MRILLGTGAALLPFVLLLTAFGFVALLGAPAQTQARQRRSIYYKNIPLSLSLSLSLSLPPYCRKFSYVPISNPVTMGILHSGWKCQGKGNSGSLCFLESLCLCGSFQGPIYNIDPKVSYNSNFSKQPCGPLGP